MVSIENNTSNNILLRGNMFTETLPSNDRGDTQADPQALIWYDTDRIKHAFIIFSIVECIRSRGNVFTETLPSNGREDTHTDTKNDGGRVL
jgi:hypothetical protein